MILKEKWKVLFLLCSIVVLMVVIPILSYSNLSDQKTINPAVEEIIPMPLNHHNVKIDATRTALATGLEGIMWNESMLEQISQYSDSRLATDIEIFHLNVFIGRTLVAHRIQNTNFETNQESPFAIIGQNLYGTKKCPTNLWLEKENTEKMSISVVGYSPHCEVEIIAMCPSMIGHGDGNLLGFSKNYCLNSAYGINDGIVSRICTGTIQQDPEVIYIGNNFNLNVNC